MTKRVKWIVNLGILLVIGGGLLLITGHKKKLDAEQRYLGKIESQAKDLAVQSEILMTEKNDLKKLDQLREIYAEFIKYKETGETDDKIVDLYEEIIEDNKQYFLVKNEKVLNENVFSENSSEDIEKLKIKIQHLNDLKDEIALQEEIIYTKQEIISLNNDITDHLEKNQKQIEEIKKQEVEKEQEQNRINEITSTENFEKYIEAYNEFSMQENPKGITQRGGSWDGIPELSASLGLTEKEYESLVWGIVDYYGNALEQKWITEEQYNSLTREADGKLHNGDYAMHPIVASQQVTRNNVLQYVEKYVAEATGWALEYMEIREEDGGFKVYFISQDPEEKAKKGYINVTYAGVVSRHHNVGGDPLGEVLQITIP